MPGYSKKWGAVLACSSAGGGVLLLLQVSDMHPIQIWMHTLGIYTLSKTNTLISPLKDL